MTAPIIVGVNDSDTARRAAFSAANLAVALDAPLHLVMAVSKTKPQSLTGGGEHWQIDWLSSAEQFLDALIGELPSRNTTRSVSLKDPATAMCEEAKKLNARMIIVGNRRMQGISRVLGAVASDVARHAPCDVLITYTADD